MALLVIASTLILLSALIVIIFVVYMISDRKISRIINMFKNEQTKLDDDYPNRQPLHDSASQ